MGLADRRLDIPETGPGLGNEITSEKENKPLETKHNEDTSQ
jgi:hypothetical protein